MELHLLQEVSRLYPQTVRIVLSGQAAKGDVYRAVAPMHQYLAKPCDADVLRSTVARAFALREMLDSTKSHELIGRISSLPSLPSLYQEIVAVADSPNGTVAAVGDIVAKDVAMTAKLLQLSNSAIFGARAPVKTPAQAASLLGMENIKSLVLSMQVFTSYGTTTGVFSIEDLMTHSLRVATIAQSICKLEGCSKDICSEAFTAGLLHDVGKLILATNTLDEFCAVITKSKRDETPAVEVEREAFGLAHDGIGGYLLALWGIPQSIVEAVAFHHQPTRLVGKELDAAVITYFANVLANTESGMLADEERSRCEKLLDVLAMSDRMSVWSLACTNDEELARE